MCDENQGFFNTPFFPDKVNARMPGCVSVSLSINNLSFDNTPDTYDQEQDEKLGKSTP